MENTSDQNNQDKRNLKDIIKTPFKKAMLIIQITSYFLIVGSPLIGGGIGAILKLSAKQIGGITFVVFIIGEVMFYGSLLFLGKEVVKLLQQKMKAWFKRKKHKME